MLKSALILFIAASPACAERLPDFNLNSVSAKDLIEHTFSPELIDGIREYDKLPGAPEPVCARADGLPMKVRPSQKSSAEAFRLYSAKQPYSLTALLSKGGYVQMTSSTRLRMNREKGELTVDFPDVSFGGGAYGNRTDLFVKVLGGTAAPKLSWATVICSGNSYLGYKGSTVAFPRVSGDFSITETVATGSPKTLIAGTHHWLTEGMLTLEDLCSDSFRDKMKDARAQTLPSKIGSHNLNYNSFDNSLKVSWENK
jgi:hypothetical protein